MTRIFFLRFVARWTKSQILCNCFCLQRSIFFFIQKTAFGKFAVVDLFNYFTLWRFFRFNFMYFRSFMYSVTFTFCLRFFFLGLIFVEIKPSGFISLFHKWYTSHFSLMSQVIWLSSLANEHFSATAR